MTTPQRSRRRVLIVDDTPDIHAIFRRVLAPTTGRETAGERELDALEQTLFEDTAVKSAARRGATPDIGVEVESAYQGTEAIELARAADPRFFLAFVDMRMPPGIDGIETIKGLWSIDPDLYVVICSAYSDHDWDDISRELGFSPNLLVLRKPFESIEILQIAVMVTAMYDALSALRASTTELEDRLVQFGELAELERRRSGILIDSLDTAACWVDAERRILLPNRLAEQQLGDEVGVRTPLSGFIQRDDGKPLDTVGTRLPAVLRRAGRADVPITLTTTEVVHGPLGSEYLFVWWNR